ncbi:M20/M25/M40 family metallo-hydrolase [Microbulbifer sp. SA54]|uniref:M20/M25/M40 family metallo-hydrolase n=1 Tax=Microbulbifer sp. SA54 TaxID=3401577 RepID=UPI003AABD637
MGCKSNIFAFFILGVLALVALVPRVAMGTEALVPGSAERRIEADVRYLADDLLEGREAGTRGYELAALYVAERFRSIGLKPGADESFLQSVPILEYGLADETQGSLSIMRDGLALELLPDLDYVVFPTVVSQDIDVEAELVFVGHGIESSFFGRDDYAGIDLNGKIAVFLVSTDPTLPSEEAAHFRSMKSAYASERGAVASIMLYTPEFQKNFPFEKLAKSLKASTRMAWLRENGEPHSQSPNIRGWAVLRESAARKLFPYGELGWDSVLNRVATGDVPSFSMGLTGRIQMAAKQQKLSSQNVVGVLPGVDPKLKHEYVLVTGHLDHIGVKPGHSTGTDKLYNGAMDNAVGVATMLEVARQLTMQPPKRSVIFLAVTGEEKGLIGSDYFAHNPTVDKQNIVANINIDMPILTYDFEDLVAFGAAHSSLKQLVQDSVVHLGVRLRPDPMPQQARFVGSDQYSFVKQGIPAIFVATGPGGEGLESHRKFRKENYHEPSDEWSLIQYSVAAKFAAVNQQITAAVANARERPQWNEGDYFGVTFAGNKLDEK